MVRSMGWWVLVRNSTRAEKYQRAVLSFHQSEVVQQKLKSVQRKNKESPGTEVHITVSMICLYIPLFRNLSPYSELRNFKAHKSIFLEKKWE
jgi:hypothetical protein